MVYLLFCLLNVRLAVRRYVGLVRGVLGATALWCLLGSSDGVLVVWFTMVWVYWIVLLIGFWLAGFALCCIGCVRVMFGW